MTFDPRTDPALRVYTGVERRVAGSAARIKPQMAAWKQMTVVIGLIVAVMGAVGTVASFLRPSIVSALEVEPAAHAEAEHQRLEAKVEKLSRELAQKLDDLPDRVARRIRGDGHGH